MSSYVLLIGTDTFFADLLRRTLAGSGFTVQVAEDGNAGMGRLSKIASLNPAAVFMTVELPDKEGFKFLTKAKRLSPKLPIAIVTSTVPPEELQLHQKLRFHADSYLDKRTLTNESFVEALNSLLDLHLDPSDLSEDDTSLDVEPPGVFVDSNALEELPDEAIPSGPSLGEDPAEGQELTEAVSSAGPALDPGAQEENPLSELLIDGPDLEAVHASSEPPDSPTASELSEPPQEALHASEPSEYIAELKAEIEALQADLDVARRDAMNSPFSEDFLKLRESTRTKDKEIRRLKKEVEVHANQAATLKKMRGELANKLEESTRERHAELANTADFQQRLVRAESELEATLQQHEQALASLRENHADELGALKQSHDETLADKNDDLKEILQIAKEQEANHRSQEKQLRDQLAEAEEKHRLELAESQERSLSELSAETEAWRSKLAGLEERHLSVQHELENKLKNEEAWRSKLTSLAKDGHSIQKELEEQLSKEKEQRQAETANLEKEKQQIRQELENKLKQVEKGWRSKLASLEKDGHSIQEALKSKLTKENEQRQTETDNLEKEKQQIRQELENKLKQAEKELRSKLASLEKDGHSIQKALKNRLTKEEEQKSSKLAALEQEKGEILAAKEELEQEYAAESQNAAREFALEKGQHDETQRMLEAKVTELQTRLAELSRQADVDARSQLAAESRQREENEQAIKEWSAKLEKQQREHSDALDALKSKYEGEMEDNKRRLAEQEEEITSLQAMVQDSYR